MQGLICVTSLILAYGNRVMLSRCLIVNDLIRITNMAFNDVSLHSLTLILFTGYDGQKGRKDEYTAGSLVLCAYWFPETLYLLPHTNQLVAERGQHLYSDNMKHYYNDL